MEMNEKIAKIQFLKEKWKELVKIEEDLAKRFSSPKDKEPDRTFSLDGRIVGDIVEEIACICFDLKKNNGQGKDAKKKSPDGKDKIVEIKSRRKSDIGSFKMPQKADYLLLFQFVKGDELKLKIFFNGEIEDSMRGQSFNKSSIAKNPLKFKNIGNIFTSSEDI